MNDGSAILLVANFDSGAGFAWWLMESFWARLAVYFHKHYRIILAYPSISTLPQNIADAPLSTVVQDFNAKRIPHVLEQCRFLRRLNVRCIYFTDQETWHWRYFLYRLYGVRYIIVHDHTPGLRSPSIGFKRCLKQWIHRSTLLSVDGAIGATEFVRQRLIQVNGMPTNRCYVAPNGLPSLEQQPIPAPLHELFQIPRERKILVMTGRAHRYKQVQFVLQCIAYLFSFGIANLHFLFVGDGPDLMFFKVIAEKLDIADRCTFAGRRQDIPFILEAADIAIHPSHGEVGYSLSILEYMRAGLPVVVPDNPSVRGATEHGLTGMVYPEGDIHKASSILLHLLRDADYRNRIGGNARIAALKRFSLETTHRALLDAFNNILQASITAS